MPLNQFSPQKLKVILDNQENEPARWWMCQSVYRSCAVVFRDSLLLSGDFTVWCHCLLDGLYTFSSTTTLTTLPAAQAPIQTD